MNDSLRQMHLGGRAFAARYFHIFLAETIFDTYSISSNIYNLYLINR